MTGPTAPPRQDRSDDAGSDDTGRHKDGEAQPRAARARSWLPWVLVVVAFGVAAAATLGWWSQRSAAQERQEVAEAASATMMTLTNWHGNDLDAVRAELEGMGTESLQDEAATILEQFSQVLQQARAESTGEVVDLVAEPPRGDRAATMAIVEQEITSLETEEASRACWGVRLLLVREEGVWLADQIETYGPGPCPGAG